MVRVKLRQIEIRLLDVIIDFLQDSRLSFFDTPHEAGKQRPKKSISYLLKRLDLRKHTNNAGKAHNVEDESETQHLKKDNIH